MYCIYQVHWCITGSQEERSNEDCILPIWFFDFLCVKLILHFRVNPIDSCEYWEESGVRNYFLVQSSKADTIQRLEGLALLHFFFSRKSVCNLFLVHNNNNNARFSMQSIYRKWMKCDTLWWKHLHLLFTHWSLPHNLSWPEKKSFFFSWVNFMLALLIAYFTSMTRKMERANDRDAHCSYTRISFIYLEI